MKINFFTTQPFTIDVNGKSYSLSKSKKTWVVIAGIAGLALLGIGAIFTFYGASYLLRKHEFNKINGNNLKSIINPITIQTPPSQNLNSPPNEGKIIAQLKNKVINITEELKPINEIESIQYSAIFHSGSKSLSIDPQDIVASNTQNLQEILALAVEASFEKAKSQNGIQNSFDDQIVWNVIAKDNKGFFHAVIVHGILSDQQNQTTDTELKDFFRNVDPKSEDSLNKIISNKMIV